LYATVKQQKGRIDVLFANAGFAEFAPLGEITEAHFDKTFNINVKAVLFTVQKALPLFQDNDSRGGSSIILNASIAASKGIEANSVYSATKAAVRTEVWSQVMFFIFLFICSSYDILLHIFYMLVRSLDSGPSVYVFHILEHMNHRYQHRLCIFLLHAPRPLT
jgi:hypothetical protein